MLPKLNYLNKMLLHYAIICLFTGIVSISYTQGKPNRLTFKNKLIAVNAEPDAKDLTIVFPFENKSSKTVVFTRQAAACACLGATFKDDKKTYLAGEKGELTAIFKLGSLYGTVDKKILLWLDGDGNNEPSIILTTRVTIPELLTVEPRNVGWEIGALSGPKVFKIVTQQKNAIHVTNVASTNNNFDTELRTIRAGWEYELVVKAKDTSKASFGIIKIKTDSTVPRFRSTQAFVHVRRDTALKK